MTNVFLLFIAISGAFLVLASLFSSKNEISPPRFDKQMQIEFRDKQENLLPNGSVAEEGWARHAIWRYMRSRINANYLRIKEWDYYATYVGKERLWVTMTVADLGYVAMYSMAVIDLNLKKYAQIEELRALPLGNVKLPPSSLHDQLTVFNGSKINISISKQGERRSIYVRAPKLVLPDGKIGLEAEFAMYQLKTMESINIQTSWAENRKCFYLNEKVNGMVTRGSLKSGNADFNVIDDSYTVLDWGRGYWTYQNTWYWGSATGMHNGHKIGINLGYGFSDRTPATENAIFYDDVIHKIGQVTFDIPSSGFIDEWTIKSDDGRLDLIFTPSVDRISRMNFIVLKTVQDQVFGSFSGTIKLDNGEAINIENLPGFAEKVFNRW